MVRDTWKFLRFARSFLGRRMVHLNLQILYDCNFRCRICDFWGEAYRDMPRLSAAQVRVAAGKLSALGPMIVSIGGGEPLLHDELPEITRILAREHFPVMITNGWFVTRERARALLAAGLDEASVSVDYADPRRHDAQRGMEGAFDKAVEALRILHESRAHATQRVHMISVIMDDNVDDVEPLIRLARDIGVTYLVTFYSDGRGNRGRRASPRDISLRLLALAARHPDFVALPGFIARFGEMENGGVRPCRAGRNLLTVDCQGNVTRCIDRLKDPVGNILTDDVRALRDRLLSRAASEGCGDCWTSCRGSIESLMYGGSRLADLRAYYRMVKPVPLAAGPPGRAAS